MIGGDAGGEVGLQVSAAQAAGVALNQFAAVETGLDNLPHPLATVQHAVAYPSPPATPRTSGQPSMVSISAPVEIGAGHFETRRGGNAGRRGDHHLQRQMAAGVHRIAHASDAEDVGPASCGSQNTAVVPW